MDRARIKAQFDALLPGQKAQLAGSHLKARIKHLLRGQPGQIRQVNQRVSVLAERAGFDNATARHFANFVDYVIQQAQNNPARIIAELNDYRPDRAYPQQP